MKSLFVTATGTDIGKTFVCCRLLEALPATLAVRCIKPVVTGFDPDSPAMSDPALLLGAQGCPVNTDTIAATSPYRYRAALSADMAAQREQRPISFADLVSFSQAPDGAGLNLIEGVGGIMAPLNDRHTVLDWIGALTTDLLLVTGSYLGSLSHTLTALAALTNRSLAPAAIVISQSAREPVATAEFARVLRNFAGRIPIVIMARDAQASAAELAAVLQDNLILE